MKTIGRFLSIAVASAVMLVLGMRGADAEDTGSPITIESTEVGIGGRFKVGRWTSVRAVVESRQPRPVRLEIRAPDPDGNVVAFPTRPQQLSAGTNELVGLFQTGRLEGNLQIIVADDTSVLASRQFRLSQATGDVLFPVLSQSEFLVATLGLARTTLSADGAESGSPERRPPFNLQSSTEDVSLVALGSSASLPTVAAGFESLDVLVVAGTYGLSPEQSAALRDWVRAGGHLVLSVGRNVETYRNSPLAEWMPVPVEGQSRVRQLAGLETFVGKNTRITMRGSVEAATFGDSRAQVLVPGLAGPLLVRAPFGFGEVTMLAVDLDQPPLTTWESYNDLMVRLVLPERDQPGTATSARRGQLAHSGITDLATQLQAALQQFPAVRRFSSWMVLGIMLGYLLLIGPIDYLLVHRVLKRPHLTWITFPLMVVAAAGLTAWWADRGNGTELRVNQLDVVDIDEMSGLVRTHSWASIYSPATQRYQVTMTPLNADWGTQPVDQSDVAASEPPENRVVWNGVPEKSFGGMYRPGGFEIARAAYHLRPDKSGIQDLPIAIWSTKGVTTEWTHPGNGLIESQLTTPGVGLLNGTIRHSLPVPIEDWMIAYGRRVYRPVVRAGQTSPEPFRPHETLSPTDPTIQQRDLSNYLTGTFARRVESKTVKGTEETRIEQTRYDQLNRNPLDVLRMMTFHQAAGGSNYTGLENNALRSFDMTERLGMNQAVLFGRIDARAAALLIGDSDQPVEPAQKWTFVRVLLPVEAAAERFVPFQKPRD